MAQGTTRSVPIDTDPLLAADSDLLVASQKATKAYADTKQTALGFTPENVANKSTSTSLGTSNTLYPSQNAVKSYVDTGLATKQNSLGFTPENVANKSDSFTASSTTTYANTKALVDGLATKQNTLVLAADYTDVAFTASQTAERIIRTLFIPKGTVPIGRTLKLSALVSKTGTASTTGLRIRVGTSATPSPLSSAPSIANATGITAVNTFFPFLRNFIHIQSATTISTGANAILDTIQSTINTINADWANVDYWLILTCEHNIISADAYTSYELILSL